MLARINSNVLYPTVSTCLFVRNRSRAVHHGQKCMALVTVELDYLKPEQ